MNDILFVIAARTAERVEQRKAVKPMADLVKEAEAFRTFEPDAPGKAGWKDTKVFPFETALKKERISLICEVKKASPSKGVLDESFPYLQIASEYEDAGADAISVLTEPDWFLGDDRHLSEIRKQVCIPVLRKDFIVDPYQVYEAKILGADAILLICALHEGKALKEYLRIAREIGLSVLTEVHTEAEVHAALEAGAEIIGANNRDLRTFQVDIGTSIRLREMVPDDIIFVSESGIRTREDIACLEEHKVNAVLIGETLMKSQNKNLQMSELRGGRNREDKDMRSV